MTINPIIIETGKLPGIITILLLSLLIAMPKGGLFNFWKKNQDRTPTGVFQDKNENRKHRKQETFVSPLAGSWYPGTRESLTKQLEEFSAQALQVKPLADVTGLILPHAGYRYSGFTGMMGLKVADLKGYKRIIVIGPSHRLPLREKLSLPAAANYQTPLGSVPLDREFITKLLSHSMFISEPAAHREEHSVQIEIPLLQYMLKNFKLVPIVAGRCSPNTIFETATVLKTLVDANTLVIASSDFTHYGENYNYVPFTRDIPANIKKLDMGAFRHIRQLDSRAFLEYCSTTGATICGAVPIAILTAMAPANTAVHNVHYTTSGEKTGDWANSVSYFAIAFTGGRRSAQPQQAASAQLSKDTRSKLLQLARQAIHFYLSNNRLPTAIDLNFHPTEKEKTQRAVFVTLNHNGHLRGCIGDIMPSRPLFQSVIHNAVNAAVHDRRFSRVKLSELKKLSLSISVLTVPSAVSSINDIRLGRDGIILKKNGRSAVFLPQVAPEQGWDLPQTLSHLAAKAGLPSGAWKTGAQFLTFQAEVFKE